MTRLHIDYQPGQEKIVNLLFLCFCQIFNIPQNKRLLGTTVYTFGQRRTLRPLANDDALQKI